MNQGIEGYLQYVESAERMMDRRSEDCRLFIFVNTVLLTCLLWHMLVLTSIVGVAVSMFGLGILYVWKKRLAYYRMHVSNKYSLINDMEEWMFPEGERTYILEYEKLIGKDEAHIAGKPHPSQRKVIWFTDAANVALHFFGLNYLFVLVYNILTMIGVING